MPVSSRGYLVFAIEETTGTPPEREAYVTHTDLSLPRYWAYPVEEVEFTPGKEFIDFREIRGSRQAFSTLDGPFRPTASVRGAVYPGAALGQLLYGTLGDVRLRTLVSPLLSIPYTEQLAFDPTPFYDDSPTPELYIAPPPESGETDVYRITGLGKWARLSLESLAEYNGCDPLTIIKVETFFYRSLLGGSFNSTPIPTFDSTVGSTTTWGSVDFVNVGPTVPFGTFSNWSFNPYAGTWPYESSYGWILTKVSNLTLNAGASVMLFSDGAHLPSLTLERSDGRDGTATIVEQLAGCKVESMQFEARFGEKVNLTVQFQGARRPMTLATSAALPANAIIYPGKEAGAPTMTIEPLYFNRAALKLSGSGLNAGYLKDMQFELRNTITRQEVLRSTVDAQYPWKISETVDSYKLFEGGMECTLSGTAVFEDTEFYSKVLNGETLSIELLLASNTVIDINGSSEADDIPYLLAFYWPKVKVARASVPFRAGEVIESQIEFKVIYDPGATLVPIGEETALTGIRGGSVFVQMLTHHHGESVNGVLRPSFY